VLAAPNEAEGKTLPKMVRGSVASIDEGKTFFVIQSEEQELRISVNSDTQYFKAPTPRKAIALASQRRELRQPKEQERVRVTEQTPEVIPHRQILRIRQQLRIHPVGEEATFADITTGARVTVRVVSETNNPLAKSVLIIKPEAYKHIGGTITAVSLEDKTITVAPIGDGEAVTLKYNEDMVVKVVLISTRTPEPTD